jgi:two-component system sensor histidine kinase/response regulator
MDGLEATRQIRRLFKNGPRIIAVTAYAVPGMMQKCLEAGMNDYLVKPMRLNELGEALRNYQPSLSNMKNVAKGYSKKLFSSDVRASYE